jgi:Xaa-Pro dipeptidase
VTDNRPVWEQLPAETEIRCRIQALQTQLRAAKLDAAWILQPADLYYFARTAQQGLLFVPAEGEPLLRVRKSVDRARAESPFPAEPLPSYRHWPALLAGHGIAAGAVGLELDVLPAGEYLRMVKEFPGTRFADAAPIVRRLRQVKSAYELACQEEAGRRLAAALDHLRRTVRPGMDERAIAAEMEGALRRAGDPGHVRVRNWRAEVVNGVTAVGISAAHPVAFDGPVGSVGAHPALPTGPGARVLRPGEPLVVDVVASAGGYQVDVTRVFYAGELPAHFRRGHEFIRELLGWLETQLVPGVVPAALYQETVARAEAAGYGEVFMNRGGSKVSFIGHGIGLELDEWPVLADGWTDPLAPGMVVAVEPKLIFDDGGVGLENTYAIAESGPPRKFPLFDEALIRL